MAKKSNPKKSASAARKAPPPIAKKVRKLVPPRLAAKLVRRSIAVAPPVAGKKIKSPLSKAELDEFRQLLLEKRRAILGDMSGIEAEALRTNRQDGSGDLSNMPTHPADIGTDNFEQEFTLGLLESERTLLSEINTALDRVDNGTYGVCLGTGQPIGAARLRARPWAKYCIEYAKLLEKGLVNPNEERRAGRGGDEDEDEAAHPAVEGESEAEEAEPAEEEEEFTEERDEE